jgi:hypothetical protein
MDPYKVVGVLHTATTEEIKRAFRDKARLLHPDKGQEVTGEKFRELVYARDLLLREKVLPSTNGIPAFNPLAQFAHFTPFGFQQTTFFQPPPTHPPFDFATFYSTYFPSPGQAAQPTREEKKWKQYFFKGKLVPQRNKEYTNVSTNRVIKNLDRRGFVFLDVGKVDNRGGKDSETHKGPLFCGEKAAMKEFCQHNNLDAPWIA